MNQNKRQKFALIRSLLMENYKANYLSIEDYMEIDSVLEELEGIVIMISEEANA